MFIKAALAKFEWEGQPQELPDLFIENLLLHSSSYNFAVVNITGKKDERANGEFWGYYNILEYEPKYSRAAKIQVFTANGQSYATNDFILFNNFGNTATLNSSYIKYYSQIIQQINKALQQHITASELIATVYAASEKEAAELKKLFENFNGVKIVKHDTTLLDGGKKADIVQFEIVPRLKELEDLKHEIEKDLFLRLGINCGTDKTHITNINLEDSEQVLDLVNSYELKLRQDFCKRYNAWKGADVLKVKIHNITKENSIQQSEQSEEGAENVNE